MIKVINEIPVHEVNGKESPVPSPILAVSSHWNIASLVVLEIHGQKITVAARDLQAAVLNATNTSRY